MQGSKLLPHGHGGGFHCSFPAVPSPAPPSISPLSSREIICLISRLWKSSVDLHGVEKRIQPRGLRPQNDVLANILRSAECGSVAPFPDFLALNHVSRIFGHCNIPALPFCLVCGRGISSCSVLKYWLGNEKQEVLGCCNVRKFYCHALERWYLFNTYHFDSD